MSLLVRVEIINPREAFSTRLALVAFPEVRMLSLLVSRQLTGIRKTSRTRVANVRFLTSVCSSMFDQMTTFSESLAASFTNIRLLSGVNSVMRLVIADIGKTLAAGFTLIRLLSTVNFLVLSQRPFLPERLSTSLTLMLHTLVMIPRMLDHILQLLEQLITRRTSVVSFIMRGAMLQ